jgi:hypothetical protein
MENLSPRLLGRIHRRQQGIGGEAAQGEGLSGEEAMIDWDVTGLIQGIAFIIAVVSLPFLYAAIFPLVDKYYPEKKR